MKSLIEPNPHGRAAPVLLEAWRDLSNLVQAQLMSQTHLKPAQIYKRLWPVSMRLAGRKAARGRMNAGLTNRIT